jgi:AcrR family transcriptional regulator
MARQPASASESPSTQGLLDEDGTLRRGPKLHPREHVEEVQRERLLSATVEVVAELGYAGLTVAQVIDRAGVSRRTFYELFKDCDDCFLATFQSGVEQLSSLVIESYLEESSWHNGVRSGLQTMLGFLDVEHGWAQLLVVESLHAGGQVMAARLSALEHLSVELEARLPREDSDHTPLPMAAKAIVGGSAWIIYCHLISRRSSSLMNLQAPIMSLIVLAYLGEEAARQELAELG